jgi:GDP/UDP-N,N'-diacetylbacillosamine 2-epimerase (hydrolysing)
LVTGARSDYGILEPVLEKFKKVPIIRPYIIITGEHLSSEGIESYKEIDTDMCAVRQVDMLLDSFTNIGISKSIGLGVISLSEAFNQIRPHVVVLVGDRFETFAAAVSAYTLNIPIAHIRGGEISGTLDDGYRHAITQLATYHFTSNEEHTERILRMGKLEENVYTVGDTTILPEKNKNPHLSKMAMLVYHPVTDLPDYGLKELENLLYVLETELATYLNFIYVSGTNRDAGSGVIDRELRDFVSRNNNTEFNQSLGHKRFVSMLSDMEVIVGNSSAGLSIAPSLGIGIINVGRRQRGRTTAPSVINCGGSVEDITKAFETLRSRTYRAILPLQYNPYRFKKDAADEIVNILLECI